MIGLVSFYRGFVRVLFGSCSDELWKNGCLYEQRRKKGKTNTTPTNLKHKTMLSLIYSCGLRCGELLALQPHHIDSKRNIVLLKNSKGKRIELFPLVLKY